MPEVHTPIDIKWIISLLSKCIVVELTFVAIVSYITPNPR